MNRLPALLWPSRRVVYRLEGRRPILNAISATRGYAAVPQGAQTKPKYRHEIRTLRPDKFSSVDQPMVDLSNKVFPSLRIMNGFVPDGKKSRAGQQLHYFYEQKQQRFPDNTKGLLYFHHVPADSTQSQMRFRLCDSLGSFQHGEDLRLPNGTRWGVSLHSMVTAPANRRAILSLLQEEFSIHVDSGLNAHRVVSTLDPRKIQSSGQEVLNISGLKGMCLSFDGEPVNITYAEKITGRLSVPAGSTGVFYYKQSLTAPTRLGELRFRLCRSIQEFDQGTDLLSPLGNSDIWHLNSLSVHTWQLYKPLQRFLTKEGLLDDTLYLGTTITPLTTTMPLRVLNDPLVTTLSASRISFDALDVAQSQAFRFGIDPFGTTNKAKRELSGRVVMRFEEHPDATKNTADGPLIVLRILEMLTPTTRLAYNNYMETPKPGELLMVRRRGAREPRPWSYNPKGMARRKFLIDWIARSRTIDSGEGHTWKM